MTTSTVDATGRAQPRPPFANPDVVVQSWYVMARSKDLRSGKVVSVDLLDRRIAVWRDSTGAVHAVDGRCAHLGADLGQGRVVGDELECAFHCWRYGADGSCRSAPGHATPPDRRLRTYAARERWGLVWVFVGGEPTFELPDIDPEGRLRPFQTPAQHIQCHPHLVLGNVFDVQHFDALHGVQLDAVPEIARSAPHELHAHVHGRFESAMTRLRTGTRRNGMTATFRMLGPSLTWAHVTEPFEFHTIFTGRLSATGGCHTNTTFLLPRSPRRKLQAVLLVLALLHDDRRIMDRMQFVEAFTEADAGMVALRDMLNEMPIA